MAANLEITGIHVPEIPLSSTDDLKHFDTDNIDAEIIVKDILRDIFDSAIKQSEKPQENLNEKNYSSTENNEVEPNDLIDLTRNYKQEFRVILRNLKCQSQKTQPSSNASVEDQIKKVIEEIRNLETSVRSTIHQEGGDIDNMSEENYNSNSNQVDYKSGITDFLNDCSNGKILQAVYNDEEINDEIVIQVIDLQGDSEVSSYINQFPSEDDLEDVILNDDRLNQGDRHISPDSSRILTTSAAGETLVQNPVPNPEPEGKLLFPEECIIRKKKSIGSRLMQFFRKSRSSSSTRQNNSTQTQ